MILKGWESFCGWYWFATEKAGEQTGILPGGREVPNDTIYYGFVQGHEEEWGYFSKAEMKALSPKSGRFTKRICRILEGGIIDNYSFPSSF